MNQVPIVHATEMLTSAFGVVAASVRRQPSHGEGGAARFEVIDDAGQHWWLDVSRDGRQPEPTRAPGASRWGRYWVLREVAAHQDAEGEAAPSAPDLLEPVRACVPPGWSYTDGRVLERVGSWLAQPAGLPTATDILGQSFVDTWLRNRQHIASMHARAEALHDALGRHASVPGKAAGDSAASPVCNEAYRHQRVLRHLVESQQLLLGRQAAGHPVALRRDALRRLTALLDAVQAREMLPDTLWRAG